MSSGRNIQQVYAENPANSLLLSDLIYLGRSPFGAANNSAILAGALFINDFDVEFGSVYADGITSSDSFAARKTTNQLVLGVTNTTTINSTAPSASRVYTIPDVGTSANFILSAGTQTIGGSKSFSSAIAITATSNHIALSSPVGTATLSVINQSLGSFVYSIPNVGANANFVMTESTQTINGAKTFGANTSVSYSNAGADVILLVQNGSTSTGSNSIINNYINNSGSGNAVYRCGHTAAQKYSWGFDNDDSDAWVFSVGDTLGTNNAMRCSTTGNFSFNNSVTLSATTNQLVLGVTNTTTITSPAPSGSRTYTIPDAGGAASFMMTAGTQTATSLNTFSAGVQFATSGGTPTTLNYYQELASTIGFTSNAFSGTKTVNYNIVRNGSTVTLKLEGFTNLGNGSASDQPFTSNAALTSVFRPTTNIFMAIEVTDNSETLRGGVEILSDGTIVISRDYISGSSPRTRGNFTNNGALNVGFSDFCVSWNVI